VFITWWGRVCLGSSPFILYDVTCRAAVGEGWARLGGSFIMFGLSGVVASA
jgi:hypothetical protein